MNKKIILLIFILPLILLFSIYTTGTNIPIQVKAPVSNIEIVGNNFVYLDYDSNEKYFVNYTIYPKTAANKKVVFFTERVGDQRYAQLDFVDGYIVPKSTGVAKVYLSTVDGGFKDSFIVRVDSLKVQEIICATATTALMVGDSINIQTMFIPEDVGNKILHYTTSNADVATVSDKGIIKGVGRGTATITITADGNSSAIDTIEINVYNQDILDLSESEIYTWQEQNYLNFSVDTTENYDITYQVLDLSGNDAQDAFDSLNTGIKNNQLEFCFVPDFYGSVVIKLTITTDNPIRQPLTKSCVVHRVEELIATFDEGLLSYTAGVPFALHNKINVTPSNAEYHFEVELSNDNIAINDVSNRIRLTAVLPGITTAIIKVVSNIAPYQTITFTKEIVILPSDMQIVESANTYGIENIWTVGGYEVDGSKNISKINLSLGKTNAGEGFENNFVYLSSNEKVSVENDGLIKILDDNFEGNIAITGKFEYQGIVKQTQPITIRCVGKGVNIRNFDSLYFATNSGKIVVLQTAIKEDFGKDKFGKDIYNESSVTKINSTYDTTHYKNIGKQDQAKIKVLISFKEDVYGNGYQINAHNVAYGLDAAGKLKSNALFKGPLNFVSMSESSSSFVSVKAQDNVSFAVYQNVTLNNVVLSSCEITPDKSGNYDLTDLTYVGTTVEVFGDNVNIEHCRINNGRTVLRAFGDIEDSSKVIRLNIKNCVLSSAREFIIRMGSNAFVDGTKENPSPYLDGQERSFPAQKTYETMTLEQRQEYESKYIKTFINIKNSILKDAGLFCIGMDTHFSGGALADGTGLAGGLVDSWHDLAKTSYGAKLTFEGDVRMYDWKEVSKVDSSTLIEIVGSTTFDGLSFDIRELINSLATNSSNPQLNTIVYNHDGKKFVHGGIAMFGGGKNYSVFETKDYTFKILNGYDIKLSDVNKVELQVAAGNESFYFLLNDSTTQGFLPEDQTRILNSDEAYAPIYLP